MYKVRIATYPLASKVIGCWKQKGMRHRHHEVSYASYISGFPTYDVWVNYEDAKNAKQKAIEHLETLLGDNEGRI